MSKGMFSGKLYASVEIDFQDAFDDLSEKEQKEFIEDNLVLADFQSLVSELESRGFTLVEGGRDGA